MDLRREPRFPSQAAARVRALTGEGSESSEGRLQDVSGRGVRILVNQPFAVNTPVRIDVGERLLLGDVCYCREEGERYEIGVSLSHAILEMSPLTKLMEHLQKDPAMAAGTKEDRATNEAW